MPTLCTLDQGRIIYHDTLGRNGLGGTKNALDGSYDDEIKKFQVGQPLDQVLVGAWQSPEGSQFRDNVQPAAFKERDQFRTENDELKKELAENPSQFVKLTDVYIKK